MKRMLQALLPGTALAATPELAGSGLHAAATEAAARIAIEQAARFTLFDGVLYADAGEEH